MGWQRAHNIPRKTWGSSEAQDASPHLGFDPPGPPPGRPGPLTCTHVGCCPLQPPAGASTAATGNPAHAAGTEQLRVSIGCGDRQSLRRCLPRTPAADAGQLAPAWLRFAGSEIACTPRILGIGVSACPFSLEPCLLRVKLATYASELPPLRDHP